jgi:hypothetical protein
MDPSPLWYESIRHTFILAHYVTPLKGGWVHSISLGRNTTVPDTLREPYWSSEQRTEILDTGANS